MRTKYPSGAGVGTSSIMLIIVMLCLTVFSVLAFITVRVDGTLTDKTVTAAREYYLARSRAEKLIMQVDEINRSGGRVEELQGVQVEGDVASFSVQISGMRTLEVSLRLKEGGYEIIRYMAVDHSSWQNEPSEEVWG